LALGRTRRLLACLVTSAAIASLAACGGTPHDVVVRIGDAAISKSTVDHWMSVMAGGRAPPDSSNRRRALRQQALSFLIGSRWVIGEAAAQGLKVSEREVAQRVAQKESAFAPGGEAELHELLEATGQRVTDIAFEAKAELASSKIRQALVSKEPGILSAQIARYYTRNKPRFAIPERREIEITNRKSAAEAIKLRSEVVSGRSFAAASRREWVERASEPGRDAGRGTPKQNALERAIYTAKPNMLIGPVKQRVDYFMFEVKRIVPASYRSLAQVRGAIAKRLTAEQQRRTLAQFISAWRKKWIAKTDCHTGYVVRKCRQYEGSRATPEDPYTLS